MPDHPTPIDDAALDAMIAEIADDPERQRSDYPALESTRNDAEEISKWRLRVTEALAGVEAAGEDWGQKQAQLREAKYGRVKVRDTITRLARRARVYREELNGGPPVEQSGKPLPEDCAAILRRYLPSSDKAADRRSSGPEAP